MFLHRIPWNLKDDHTMDLWFLHTSPTLKFWGIPLLVFIWLLMVLDDPEQNFPAMEAQDQGGKLTSTPFQPATLLIQVIRVILLQMRLLEPPSSHGCWWHNSLGFTVAFARVETLRLAFIATWSLSCNPHSNFLESGTRLMPFFLLAQTAPLFLQAHFASFFVKSWKHMELEGNHQTPMRAEVKVISTVISVITHNS